MRGRGSEEKSVWGWKKKKRGGLGTKNMEGGLAGSVDKICEGAYVKDAPFRMINGIALRKYAGGGRTNMQGGDHEKKYAWGGAE